MSQITPRSSCFRLAVSTAVAFASLIGLIQPVRADLLVSSFSDGNVRKFDERTGLPIPPIPFVSAGGGGGEGVGCLTIGGQAVFFIANNTGVIGVYSQGTGTLLRNFPDLRSTYPGSAVAALSLSSDGLLLYAADFGSQHILGLDTTTGNVIYSVSTPNSHDVIVGPDGSVYATSFNSNTGVLRFTKTLVLDATLPAGQFIPPNDHGLDRPGGMTFDATGTFFFVSRFQPSSGAVAFVNEYSVPTSGTATWVQTFAYPAGSAPLGLALGPDGNVYSANFGAGSVGKIDLTTNLVSTFVPSPTAGLLPKYLFFTGINCRVATDAFIEVCKSSSITSPVTGNFTFTATNGAFTSAPIVVPVGYCSGPIPVPAGTVTVTETPTTGTGVSAIKAFGYGPTSIEGNLLLTSDLTKGTATVKATAGDSSTETVVDFTNYETPTGILEVCKDAAPGGPPVMGAFSFTVSGAPHNPYVLPAGACSGPILVQAGSVTITETPRTGFQLVDVDTFPLGRLVSTNIPGGSAVVTVAAGGVSTETVARFINGTVGPDIGQLKICKIAGPGIALGQTFTISVNGVPYTVPAGPASQGGFCIFDGTFPVGTVVTVQELIPLGPPPPYQVLNIAVDPPDRSSGTPDLLNGKMVVTIGTGFTEVTFTNIGSSPMGQLKICKIAGTGIAVGTNFTFTATGQGSSQTYTVPAGPASEGGYCVVDGAFPLGTQVTVTEVVPTGTSVKGITVSPASRGGATSGNSVVATIGTGFTEVTFTNMVPTVVPTGSCQPSSSLSVLATGPNVVVYVPKGSWSGATPGVAVVNLEGSSITPTRISTNPDVINSCASNSVTGQTVCTANNSNVYLLAGAAFSPTTPPSPLSSAGTGSIGFSGGNCTNCGVAMDSLNNRAVIGLSLAHSSGGSVGGFQILNLGSAPFFGTAFASQAPLGGPHTNISEDLLIDPIRNLLLSANEQGNYEIVKVAPVAASTDSRLTVPEFFENATKGGNLDSSGEDCTTGIALAPAEFSTTSNVFFADLTQPNAVFTSGSPGMWTAPSAVRTLTGSALMFGANGIAVAQGTHTAVVTGEFGGDAITAVALPATSGSGFAPAVTTYLTCNIGGGFMNGGDPHTVTAYQSPGGFPGPGGGAAIPVGNAVAVLANGGANMLAVVDLTKMLADPLALSTHKCASGTTLTTAGVVSFVTVP